MALVRNIKKDYSSEVRSIIDNNDDIDLLQSCSSLIKDMIDIDNMKESIDKMQKELLEREEKLLSDDSRVMFSFFLNGMEQEQIAAIGDKVLGRISVLNRKKEEEDNKIAAKNKDAEQDQKQGSKSEEQDGNIDEPSISSEEEVE
jgi:hypothetical protein